MEGDDPPIGLSFAVGVVLFLIGREAHAYFELKSEVAELKQTVSRMEVRMPPTTPRKTPSSDMVNSFILSIG